MTGRKTWSFTGYHLLLGYIFQNSFEASQVADEKTSQQKARLLKMRI